LVVRRDDLKSGLFAVEWNDLGFLPQFDEALYFLRSRIALDKKVRADDFAVTRRPDPKERPFPFDDAASTMEGFQQTSIIVKHDYIFESAGWRAGESGASRRVVSPPRAHCSCIPRMAAGASANAHWDWSARIELQLVPFAQDVKMSIAQAGASSRIG
jgi:hypothetical protein